MRTRVVGLVLIGLGAFALVAALAVRVFLVPDVVKLPLDQNSEPTGVASDMDWFAIGTQTQHTGETGAVNQRIIGDPASADADGDTAVWSAGTVIKAEDGTMVSVSEYTACLDRHAAAAADCDSAATSVPGGSTPEGLTVTFPFHTEPKDYDVYNGTVGATLPAEYAGADEVAGLDVYRFEQTVPETVTQSTEVTALMAGVTGAAPGTMVPADVVHTNRITWWVEPTSGIVVTSEQHPDSHIRTADGNRGVTMFAADVVASEDTVATQAELVDDTRSQIVLVEKTLPLGLVAIGVLALAAGVFLFTRRPRGAGVHRVDSVDEPPTSVLAGH